MRLGSWKKLVVVIVVGYFLSVASPVLATVNLIKEDVFAEAEKLSDMGNYRGAVILLKKLYDAYPSDAEILIKLATAEILLAGFDSRGKLSKSSSAYDAIEHLSEAVKIDPGNEKYKMAYAQLLHDLEYHERASHVFSELFYDENFRHDERTRYLVIDYAITLQKIDRVKDSLEEYRKSLKLTNYDKVIFHSYIGGLSYAGQIDQMIVEYNSFESNYGFIANIKYIVCKELLANKIYGQAKTCYLELLGRPNVDEHIRMQARIDLKFTVNKLNSK